MKKIFFLFVITMLVGVTVLALTFDIGGGIMYLSPYVMTPTAIADLRVPVIGDLFLTGQVNLMVLTGSSLVLGGIRYSFFRDWDIKPFAGLDGGILLTTDEHRPSTLPIFGFSFGMDFTINDMGFYLKGAYRSYNNPQALSHMTEIGAGMVLEF